MDSVSKFLNQRLTTAQSIVAAGVTILVGGAFFYCRHLGWWQVSLAFAIASLIVWIMLFASTIKAIVTRAKSRDAAIFYGLELTHLLGVLGLIVCLTMDWDHSLAMAAWAVPKGISRLMFGNDPPKTEVPATAP